ncbi:MAG: penicillin-binding protein 2 [Planctomycetes bacterium]|nr:penicillin-binding protein 2 [Planctomycetota bacterium]
MSPGRLFASARLPMWVLGVLLLVLWGRLVQVQVLRRDRYDNEVDRAVLKSVVHPAERGRIVDRSGRVLADNRGTVHLVADCKELEAAEGRNIFRYRKQQGLEGAPDEAWKASARVMLRTEMVADLAAVLQGTVGVNSGSVAARARDLAERLGRLHKDRESGRLEPARRVVLARDLTPDEEVAVTAALRKHRVSVAFSLEKDFERIYPAGASVSSVLGFVGARLEAGSNKSERPTEPGPERIGRGGIEGKLEPWLRGAEGKEIVLRAPTARGGALDLGGASEGTSGIDCTLTIDATLNAILHEQLLRANREFPCEHGITGIVLSAKTGEVLAMDTVPSFDPNARPGEKNHPVTNKALVNPYEPGSAIKPFTIAAALEAGAVHVNDTFALHNGVWSIPGRRKPIKDSHFDSAHNVQSVGEILARSSNVGAVKIGHRAGSEVIEESFRRYGFHDSCGIDLPGEARPRLPRRDRGRPWDVPNTLSSVCFGYQMMLTPIRFAAAYAMLANGGLRVEPRLVRAIRFSDGREEIVAAPEPVRVMREDVAKTVQRLCHGVVTEEYGTAYKRAESLRQAGYLEVDTFAGKTGSAVVPSRPDRINGTFACFGPMPDPEIVVLFVAFEPKGARFGGDICAQPALETLALCLRALGLTSPSPRRVRLGDDGNPVIEPVPIEAEGNKPEGLPN